MSKSKVVKKPRSLKALDGMNKIKRNYKRPAPSTAFKHGNDAWSFRTKVGRDCIFASADVLWEEACKYFKWCDDNPWMRNEAKTESMGARAGSSTTIVQVPVGRPYLWRGLCFYLGVSDAYFRVFKYEHKDDKVDFLTVIAMIEDVIYKNKMEGAMIGAYNANIVSRDLGLVDRQSTEHSIADDSKKHFPFGEG